MLEGCRWGPGGVYPGGDDKLPEAEYCHVGAGVEGARCRNGQTREGGPGD